MCRTRIAKAAPMSMAQWLMRRANCAASIMCAKTLALRGEGLVVVPVARVQVRREPESPASAAARVVRWGASRASGE